MRVLASKVPKNNKWIQTNSKTLELCWQAKTPEAVSMRKDTRRD